MTEQSILKGVALFIQSMKRSGEILPTSNEHSIVRCQIGVYQLTLWGHNPAQDQDYTCSLYVDQQQKTAFINCSGEGYLVTKHRREALNPIEALLDKFGLVIQGKEYKTQLI